MKTVWTAGLTPEQTTEIKKDFVGSAILRKRLTAILEGKTSSSRDASMTKDGYANPNWAYLQADARGYERALSEVISLLEK
jgi:hypothetical protein